MKISTRGRYALRIMLDIALNGSDGPVSLKEVSSRQGISMKYMEQICSTLIRAGLLKSFRGAQGGYLLVGSPSDYTVGTVLRVTEGTISIVPCLDDDACPHQQGCLTAGLWRRINDAVNEVVDNTTLQDLLDEGSAAIIVPTFPDGP